jgi:hypothetical protein
MQQGKKMRLWRRFFTLGLFNKAQIETNYSGTLIRLRQAKLYKIILRLRPRLSNNNKVFNEDARHQCCGAGAAGSRIFWSEPEPDPEP